MSFRAGPGRGARSFLLRLGLAAFIGILAFVTVWTIEVGQGSKDPSLMASLWSIFLSVAAIVITLIQMLIAARPDLSAEGVKRAADNLAAQVGRLEGEQRSRWLGGDVIPIDVEFVLAHDMGRRLSDAGPSGTLETIYTYYRNLTPRRMLITGAGGSGKTVLAVDLLLLMLDERAAEGAVPVRFSLSDWYGTEALGDWISSRISSDFKINLSVAKKLVEMGLILPILDGLDEMSSEGAESTRAVSAITSINRFRIGRQSAPLVVTCRKDFLDELASNYGVHILDVAPVVVQPLTASQAASYLHRRFNHCLGKWHGVIQRLTTDPHGVLTQSLSTPWRLTLASTAYTESADKNPDELLWETTDEDIGRHLMARYVDAVTSIHERSKGITYQPRKVITWLGNIAVHLNNTGTSDIRLHELWKITGRRAPLAAESVIVSVPTIALTYLACVIFEIAVPIWGVLLACAGLITLTYRSMDSSTIEPQHATWRQLRHRYGSRQASLIAAAIFLLFFAAELLLTKNMASFPFTAGIKYQPYDLLACATILALLVAALTPLFYAAFTDEWNVEVADPTAPIKAELRQNLLIGFMAGAYAALFLRLPHDFVRTLIEISGRLKQDHAKNLHASNYTPKGLASVIEERSAYFLDKYAIPHLSRFPGGFPSRWPGIAIWFILAGIITAFLVTYAGRRYVAMRLVGWRILPTRLSPFLSWSYDAGLLRRAGGAFQFRHRELQEWFAHQSHNPCR
ncbi:NACHT domain-containing protein [Streptomyces sp. NPDC001435]|uniref:NACHT domain-containing protein n=1 Tax=unclassified Streptomyces TaxID=2593676 RepID=UPI0036856536